MTQPPPRPPAGPTPRPARGLPDADFAELLESAREGARLLRGEAVPGARAWTVAEGRPPEPVDLATVAARVREAAAAGALTEPDAAAIRQRAGLSQEAFAAVLDVPVSTLRNWEQRRRTPRGPARQLLRVAAAAPEVLRVLQGAQASDTR